VGKNLKKPDKEQSSHLRKHTIYKNPAPFKKKKTHSCLRSSQTYAIWTKEVDFANSTMQVDCCYVQQDFTNRCEN